MTLRFLTCINRWTLRPVSESGGDFGIHIVDTKQTIGYSDKELRREVWNEDVRACVICMWAASPVRGDCPGS